MINAAEYVSLGHPDSTADAIASYLLDRYLEEDPKARFALEVQLKDHTVNLAGEVTSSFKPSDAEMAEMVRAAIRKVGYTAAYAAKWPEGATLNAEKVKVNNFVGRQSPEIAQGVDCDGWGDQGVMMGMATACKSFAHFPQDVHLARQIGRRLYRAALEGEAPIGLDIKVLVSLADTKAEIGNDIEQVIVAAPMLPQNASAARTFIQRVVEEVTGAFCGARIGEIAINGTGAYVTHSSVGDAGVVGRKLAVNFYGLNCPVGGGAPWGKDPTKSDVTLNLYARYLSLRKVLEKPEYGTVRTKIACCIGKREILVSQEGEGLPLCQTSMEAPVSKIVETLGLDGKTGKDTFFEMCRDGLFSKVDQLAERF